MVQLVFQNLIILERSLFFNFGKMQLSYWLAFVVNLHFVEGVIPQNKKICMIFHIYLLNWILGIHYQYFIVNWLLCKIMKNTWKNSPQMEFLFLMRQIWHKWLTWLAILYDIYAVCTPNIIMIILTKFQFQITKLSNLMTFYMNVYLFADRKVHVLDFWIFIENKL